MRHGGVCLWAVGRARHGHDAALAESELVGTVADSRQRRRNRQRDCAARRLGLGRGVIGSGACSRSRVWVAAAAARARRALARRAARRRRHARKRVISLARAPTHADDDGISSAAARLVDSVLGAARSVAACALDRGFGSMRRLRGRGERSRGVRRIADATLARKRARRRGHRLAPTTTRSAAWLHNSSTRSWARRGH
jgi:hypothetical protein